MKTKILHPTEEKYSFQGPMSMDLSVHVSYLHLIWRIHAERMSDASNWQNNAPVVRQDAPEMLPSDVMFYFLWFLRCFCVFFICLCHVISRLFF